MKKEYLLTAKGMLSAGGAWISNKLGILFPVLILLTGMMVLDYISGLAASKKEALENPDNPKLGWSSKKGQIGIFKKLGYIIAVAVAMAIDFLIFKVAAQLGVTMPSGTFFGLLTAVWLVLNELLSLVENAGRMGAPVPEFLSKIIIVLKTKVEKKGEDEKIN